MNQVIRVLRLSIRLLESEGWIQDATHSVDGFDLTGAIVEAARQIDPHLTKSALRAVCREAYRRGRIKCGLCCWNDRGDTTKADVIELLVDTITNLGGNENGDEET